MKRDKNETNVSNKEVIESGSETAYWLIIAAYNLDEQCSFIVFPKELICLIIT